MRHSHVPEHCSLPRARRKWSHHLWRCDCGKFWHTKLASSWGDAWWEWEEVACSDTA